MPNWCENRVTISGDSEDIIKFRGVMEGPDHHGVDSIFSFNQLIPMPVELINTTSPPTIKETQAECDTYNTGDNHCVAVTQHTVDALREEHGACDWYSWANENWGTKWQPSEIDLDAQTDVLIYHFNTAWGPPEGIWGAILGQFPKLHVTWFYDEPGMEFCGYLGDN